MLGNFQRQLPSPLLPGQAVPAALDTASEPLARGYSILGVKMCPVACFAARALGLVTPEAGWLAVCPPLQAFTD